MQMLRMHSFKDKLFERSQSVEETINKMRYLFKTIHAINKLDCWTQLVAKFDQDRAHDPWYPVPVLENYENVLTEVINPDIPQGEMQITVEGNEICRGKNITVTVSVEGAFHAN